MNKRQEELLTILIAEDDYISVEDITSRLKCSERTIRNYIKDINSWLNTFSNMYIYRKANLGIKLIDEKKNLHTGICTYVEDFDKQRELLDY